MAARWARYALRLLLAFFALTAVGGGIAILTGADSFPPEWLEGTPFADYTIPALLLAIVVGGSALLALALSFVGGEWGAAAALAAGVLMAGYVAVEAVILKQSPPGPTWIELLYFALGALVCVLALWLRRAGGWTGRGRRALPGS